MLYRSSVALSALISMEAFLKLFNCYGVLEIAILLLSLNNDNLYFKSRIVTSLAMQCTCKYISQILCDSSKMIKVNTCKIKIRIRKLRIYNASHKKKEYVFVQYTFEYFWAVRFLITSKEDVWTFCDDERVFFIKWITTWIEIHTLYKLDNTLNT